MSKKEDPQTEGRKNMQYYADYCRKSPDACALTIAEDLCRLDYKSKDRDKCIEGANLEKNAL